MIQKVKINKVFPNQLNPRIIKKDKFEKLVKSIKEFPEMLQLRPIVVDSKMNIIGGNMRFKACQELGLKEVYIIKAENLTKEQVNQFVIKDNVGFGEWDWDILANSWDTRELKDWGMDVWQGAQEDDMFDVDGSEIDAVAKEPKMTDDDYSLFELVMKHENKIILLELLSKIKKEYVFEKQEEALMEIIRIYKNQ
jgi:ParB-like chromosome segregation protein Spo0J